MEIHGALDGVLVVAAYKLPNRELLPPDFAGVFDLHRSVIMAGDLNCKHRDWKHLRRFVDARRVTIIGLP